MMTMKEAKSLIEIYPNWLLNGIFKQLEAYDVPWKDYVNGDVLDLDYYGNRSGDKLISPLITKLLVDDVLSDDNQAKIAQLVYKKYGYEWKRAWEAFFEEYNPLYNYKMSKIETEDKTIKNDLTKNKDLTHKETGTVDKANTGEVITVEADTTTSESFNDCNSTTKNKINGFDSPSSVPKDESNTEQNNTSSNTINTNNDNTVTDDRNELVTKDLQDTDNEEITEDGTTKRTGTIDTETVGNIGVTTSQQMLESELELRFEWKIFDLIFRDVDKVLTVNIYKSKKEI